MVDLLGFPELNQGDPLGYLDENSRNLVMQVLLRKQVVANNVTAPPAATRGQAWILSGTGTGLWAGQPANTLAIALDANPVSASGWHFLAPFVGLTVYVLAGSPTGHLIWTGASYSAV